MNIGLVNSVYNVGSTGRILKDLKTLIQSKGDTPFITYGRGKHNEGPNFYRIGNEFDLKLHVLKSRIFDKTGFYSKQATIQLINYFIKNNIELIHLHNLHGYYLNIEILFDFIKNYNIPTIWTLHDCWSITGHCSNFDYINCTKWKTQCNNCPQRKAYPKSILMDNSFANYLNKKSIFNDVKNLTIITPSLWLKNIVKQSYLSKYKIETIYNGIDIDSFTIDKNIKKPNNIKDKFILLSVSYNWNEKKGFDDILKLSKMIDSDTVIILVGLQEKQLKLLPPNIIGYTKTNSLNELKEIYNYSDLFINFTKEEVLGLVNLESLACGTPVITYNSGGAPECISDETGVTIPRGDYNKTLMIINKVKNKEIIFFADKCRERVIKSFNKNINYLNYYKLYNLIR